MKKVLATLLMVVSVGAMASPGKCLLNWAESQGADVGRPMSHMPNWGPNGEFHVDRTVFLVQYGIRTANDHSKKEESILAGPWNCHCTVIKHNPNSDKPNQPMWETGVCGKW